MDGELIERLRERIHYEQKNYGNTVTISLLKEAASALSDLQVRLLRAEDAARKGDDARAQTAGMQMEIDELKAALSARKVADGLLAKGWLKAADGNDEYARGWNECLEQASRIRNAMLAAAPEPPSDPLRARCEALVDEPMKIARALNFEPGMIGYGMLQKLANELAAALREGKA